MKLFIFTIALLLSNLIGFAQTEICPTSFKRNNGNGTCSQGELQLNYTTCPTNAQIIDAVYVNGVLSPVTFAAPNTTTCASKGYVSYCVTSGNMPPINTWAIYFTDAVTNVKYTCNVSTTPPVLPINIKTFTAIRQKGNVQLSWETSLETNGQAFIIERKTGNDFVSVATIAAKNIESGSIYSFTDMNDNKGVSEYRLKVVCKDVSAKYSEIKIVKGAGNIGFTIFPNPASGNTKISISDVNQSSSIQVIDNSGRVVKKLSFKTSNTIEINDLQRGIYRVQLMDNNSGETVTKTLTLF